MRPVAILLALLGYCAGVRALSLVVAFLVPPNPMPATIWRMLLFNSMIPAFVCALLLVQRASPPQALAEAWTFAVSAAALTIASLYPGREGEAWWDLPFATVMVTAFVGIVAAGVAGGNVGSTWLRARPGDPDGSDASNGAPGDTK